MLYVSTLEGPSACCHVECGDGLRLLCPVSGDGVYNQPMACKNLLMQQRHWLLVDALYVFSFLQLFCETLQDYLGEISSSTLRDHFDVVYQASNTDLELGTIIMVINIIISASRGNARQRSSFNHRTQCPSGHRDTSFIIKQDPISNRGLWPLKGKLKPIFFPDTMEKNGHQTQQ